MNVYIVYYVIPWEGAESECAHRTEETAKACVDEKNERGHEYFVDGQYKYETLRLED